LTASAAAKKTPRRRPTITPERTAGIRRYYGVPGCRRGRLCYIGASIAVP